MNLHERLRQLRHDRHLRLAEVGARCEPPLTVSTLSDLERGRITPSLTTLETLGRAYGLTLQALLEDVDFAGEHSTAAYPKGLQQLMADPVLGRDVTPDWARTLARIEWRGRRMAAPDEWYSVFRHLLAVLK